MSLLNDGLLLLVIGMGTVFSFLGIMVIWITLSSRILSGFSHLLPEVEKETRRAPAPTAAAPEAPQEDDSVLLAVITAAVHRYRAERGGAAG